MAMFRPEQKEIHALKPSCPAPLFPTKPMCTPDLSEKKDL
jgi:hypothetical protein